MLNAAVDGTIEFISRSGTGSAATFLAGGVQQRDVIEPGVAAGA